MCHGRPALPPVLPCRVGAGRNLEIDEVASAGTERVLPVDPVAVREMYESPSDGRHRRWFRWRPVVIDGRSAVGRRAHGPHRGGRRPEELRVGQAVESLVQAISGAVPLLAEEFAGYP